MLTTISLAVKTSAKMDFIIPMIKWKVTDIIRWYNLIMNEDLFRAGFKTCLEQASRQHVGQDSYNENMSQE